MIFKRTAVDDVWIMEPDRFADERGSFERIWCREELRAHGLRAEVAQCSLSHNRKRGTLRGMHYQVAPRLEAKVVSCLGGAIYDVILDLRPQSATYRTWLAVELTSQTRRMLYVPEGCAHGFQTLEDNSLVLYQISEAYSPEHAHGVRWDDPAFRIEWPHEEERVISPKDRAWPDYER